MDRSTLLNSTIGEYRIVERLGAGGMGEVFRAVHARIGRVVAIKVLSQAADTPEFLERFLNEARIQSGLNHPNIVTLYDFLEHNGQSCIIMEYVEGQTLTDVIRQRGWLPLSEVIPIFHPLVHALHYIHGQGIVHRDIKSNNVKITSSGQAKLLDFGIAKSGESPSLTMAGGFIGTLQYLSPEQLIGGRANERSDIWALGVLLYEMVTGRMPFDATTLGQLCEKVNMAVYTPASNLNGSIPQPVDAIIARCLKRDPAHRYQSAWDLLQDINRMPSHSHQSAPQQAAAYRPAPAPAVRQRTDPSTPHHTEPAPAAVTTPSRSGVKWMAVSGVTAVLLCATVAGIYLLIGGGATTSPVKNVSPQKNAYSSPLPKQDASSPQMRSVTIDVMEGRAEVYRAGEKVGATPFQFEAKQGEQIDLVLKRDGFADKQVGLTVSENKKVYTFTMNKKD